MKALSGILIVAALAQATPLKQGSPPVSIETVTCPQYKPCSLVGNPIVFTSVSIVGGFDTEALGISEMLLKTDVELELRRNGIKVEEAGELLLNVLVGTLKIDDGVCAFSVEVTGHLRLRLALDDQVHVDATTWRTPSYLGSFGKNNLKAKITEAIRDMTRQFANAYLTANPREKRGE